MNNQDLWCLEQDREITKNRTSIDIAHIKRKLGISFYDTRRCNSPEAAAFT
jgi:hypothetical protein